MQAPLRELARFAARVLLTVFGASSLLAACESEPCVGDGCPGACGGLDCDDLVLEDAAADDGSTGSGRFVPCHSDATCDVAHGFGCVRGECRHPCRSHFDCAGVGACEPLTGANDTFCEPSDVPTPGGFYARCPNLDECDERNGFLCVGAGAGDTGSFCTKDCTLDTDCAPGFLCDPVASSDGEDRPLCVPRGFCVDCDTDADCLAVPGGLCARDASGAKVCTQACELGGDSCPWGTATECALTDTERGIPTCAHRFGACQGRGRGCEPCVRASDCPGGVCFGSGYTGERWCVDQTVSCSCANIRTQQDLCTGQNGCPTTPQGLGMTCLDQGDPGNGVCLAAGSSAPLSGSAQLGCWGP